MADGTEVGIVVGAHAAVLLGAPDTLREVATTLDEGGLTSVYQRLPLGRVGGRGGEYTTEPTLLCKKAQFNSSVDAPL